MMMTRFTLARLIPTLVLLVVVGTASAGSVSQDAAAARQDAEAWLLPIADTLADHYSMDGEWTLELVRAFAPPTDAFIEIVEFPTKPTSQMMLRLNVYDAEGTRSSATIFVRVKIWRDAWVTAEPLTRGATMEAHRVETRRVDILRARDLVPADSDVSDLLVNRSLPAGRLITWRDVIRRPLVRRGQMIDVNAVDGTLAVSMKALALEDGAAGELVRVRNTESRREFAAVVIAPGNAEVRF